MDWYYANDRHEQVLVAEEELAALAGAGRLGPETLVWNTDLPDWKPCREVRPEWFDASPPSLGPVPPAPPELPGTRTVDPGPDGLSIASLILGILGLVMMSCYGAGFPFSLAAVICGHLVKKRAAPAGGGASAGMATAGLVTGYIGLGLLLLVALIVVAALAFAGAAASVSGSAVPPNP